MHFLSYKESFVTFMQVFFAIKLICVDFLKPCLVNACVFI